MSMPEWFDGARHVLFVHAHPDDESISTGGTIAGLGATKRKASVLTLTRGEDGELMPGVRLSREPEALVLLRQQELAQALAALGSAEPVLHAFLGAERARKAGLETRTYRDSGMRWDASGAAVAAEHVDDTALTRASLGDALADALVFAREIGADRTVDAIVSYDEYGGYGHPDHVFAHRLARALARELGVGFWKASSQADTSAHAYDVSEWMPQKVDALRAHRSQLEVRGTTFELTGGQIHDIATREWFARVDD